MGVRIPFTKHKAWRIIPVGLIGIVLMVFFSTCEPSHGGKSLREWLDQYARTRASSNPFRTDDGRAAAEQAIRQIGGRAVPRLTAMVRYQEGWFTPVRRYMARLTDSYYTSPAEYNELAVLGFTVLGDDAKSAVPALIEGLARQPYQSARALGAIGPAASNAIPVLMDGLTNQAWGIRSTIAYAFPRIQPNGETTIPVLMKQMRTDSFMRYSAISILVGYGSNARRAVPELRRIITEESDPEVKKWAQNVLKELE
jgi:hypothetical protein